VVTRSTESGVGRSPVSPLVATMGADLSTTYQRTFLRFCFFSERRFFASSRFCF